MKTYRSGRRNAGFTLVELVVVVGMILVIGGTSLGAYSQYVNKARYSEALSLAETAQRGVNEYFGRWGELPRNNQSAGLPPAGALRGRYVKSVEVQEGAVRVVVVVDARNPVEAALYLRPAVPEAGVGNLFWVCNQSAEALPAGYRLTGVVGSDAINSRMLPASCKS